MKVAVTATLFVIIASACGARSSAPAAFSSTTARVTVTPTPEDRGADNQEQDFGSEVVVLQGWSRLAIDHVGDYVFYTAPASGLKAADVRGASLGDRIDGGAVEFSPDSMRPVPLDTENGLVMEVAFTVTSFTGKPIIHFGRVTVDPKDSES